MHHPDLVNKLVLMEPPVLTLFVTMPPGPLQLLRLLFTRPALAASVVKFGAGAVAPAQRAYRRGADDEGLEIFGKGVLGAEAFGSLSQERLEQVRANRLADKAQLMGAGFPPLDAGSLRRLQAPTLLLHGDRSPMLFRRLTKELERLIPNAVRAEIPQASHLMHEDNPERVNALVQDFLAGGAMPKSSWRKP
jgi:pimeloyl-ACP methyl ester carboxylesterase